MEGHSEKSEGMDRILGHRNILSTQGIDSPFPRTFAGMIVRNEW